MSSGTLRKPHVVYVLRDSSGTPLYVGATAHLSARVSQHRKAHTWSPDIATVDVESEHTWQPPAMLREHEVIAELRPLHNRKGADVLWWQEHILRESMTPKERFARGSFLDAIHRERRELYRRTKASA